VAICYIRYLTILIQSIEILHISTAAINDILYQVYTLKLLFISDLNSALVLIQTYDILHVFAELNVYNKEFDLYIINIQETFKYDFFFKTALLSFLFIYMYISYHHITSYYPDLHLIFVSSTILCALLPCAPRIG
jgi:hypothetical protein